jgi:type III restriction enzyme
LPNDQLQQKIVTVVSQPQLASKLGLQSEGTTSSAESGFHEAQPVFNADEQKIAKFAHDVIRKFETQPSRLPKQPRLLLFGRHDSAKSLGRLPKFRIARESGF